MLNKGKWISSYKNLEPVNQLVVAQIIMQELKDNESLLNDGEYNVNESELVRNFFEKNESILSQNQKIFDTMKVLEKYNNMSQKNKEKVIKEIVKIVKKYDTIQEQEDKEKICLNEGHTFKKWKKITYTTKEVFWDAGPRGYIDVENNVWKRTCSRCGLVETVENEPQELIDERKEKAKKAKIKRLERELEKLKKENNN